MARPDDSTKLRRAPCGRVALLSVVLTLLVPASALAGAAVDEYSLGPVGDNDGGGGADVQRTPDSADAKPPQQLGVVGENVPAQSSLEAGGAAIWIGLGVIVLAGLVVSVGLRNTPPRSPAGSETEA